MNQKSAPSEVKPHPTTSAENDKPIPEETYAAEYLLAELEDFVLKND